MDPNLTLGELEGRHDALANAYEQALAAYNAAKTNQRQAKEALTAFRSDYGEVMKAFAKAKEA